MSRHYSMDIQIRGLKTNDERIAVQFVLDELWKWTDSDYDENDPGAFHCWGEHELVGGEGEEEFAQRCFEAVLSAVRRPVEVDVDCTFLEYLPHETYCMDEEEAEEILATLPSPEKEEE